MMIGALVKREDLSGLESGVGEVEDSLRRRYVGY